MRDYNPEFNYKEPTLIKFEQPLKVKLAELANVLNNYKPFPCADVYVYERCEYGDYGNWIDTICESIDINPRFSHTKEDGVSFCLTQHFWRYKEGKAFWKDCPSRCCQDVSGRLGKLEDIEINIDGVYVISWTDKDKMENNLK